MRVSWSFFIPSYLGEKPARRMTTRRRRRGCKPREGVRTGNGRRGRRRRQGCRRRRGKVMGISFSRVCRLCVYFFFFDIRRRAFFQGLRLALSRFSIRPFTRIAERTYIPLEGVLQSFAWRAHRFRDLAKAYIWGSESHTRILE